MSSDQEALGVATKLTSALTGMAAELKAINDRQAEQEREQKALGSYGRRNRMLIIIAIGSTVLDVIVTTIAIIAVTIALHASNRASIAEARATAARASAAAQHASLIAACGLTNQGRAASVALWDHILSISGPAPGASPAQRAQDAQKAAAFRAYVHARYAPLNCAKLYHMP